MLKDSTCIYFLHLTAYFSQKAMLTDPRQMPNAPGPDEELANETYTTYTREGADVPDLQPLLDDFTDQDEADEPRQDVDEEAQKGHS